MTPQSFKAHREAGFNVYPKQMRDIQKHFNVSPAMVFEFPPTLPTTLPITFTHVPYACSPSISNYAQNTVNGIYI